MTETINKLLKYALKRISKHFKNERKIQPRTKTAKTINSLLKFHLFGQSKRGK